MVADCKSSAPIKEIEKKLDMSRPGRRTEYKWPTEYFVQKLFPNSAWRLNVDPFFSRRISAVKENSALPKNIKPAINATTIRLH
jgi:hypothetical protein